MRICYLVIKTADHDTSPILIVGSQERAEAVLNELADKFITRTITRHPGKLTVVARNPADSDVVYTIRTCHSEV